MDNTDIMKENDGSRPHEVNPNEIATLKLRVTAAERAKLQAVANYQGESSIEGYVHYAFTVLGHELISQIGPENIFKTRVTVSSAEKSDEINRLEDLFEASKETENTDPAKNQEKATGSETSSLLKIRVTLQERAVMQVIADYIGEPSIESFIHRACTDVTDGIIKQANDENFFEKYGYDPVQRKKEVEPLERLLKNSIEEPPPNS